MVNQLKIITMTRLALYDKHEGAADRITNEYFRHDYVYRNNLGTRLAVGLGSILILVIYWLRAFIVHEMDLFQLNFQQYGIDSLMFIVAVLAAYSLIGTIQGTRQYYLVQKRLSQYQALVRQLERLEERTQRAYEDEPAEASPRKRIPPPKPAGHTSGSKPPERTRLPLPGNTAPLVRAGQAHTQSGTERPVSTGYTRPPRTAETDETRMPYSISPNATMPPRPVSSGSTVLPPTAPVGYARPHPSMTPQSDKPYPPRPKPYTAMPTGDARPVEDAAGHEHTKVSRTPERPAGS